ncbi:hypothetical protein N7457_000461 [Penicillium paradoxum]|uniref:uncharacterized protein n=1 Tax=Penicillium paradoxum TaxID=176176 RepID=UPI002546B996|nr:uncharacterized protein N7457_000461 [Penicillium paradoxum]KAJ5793862.1 hypothetical protein N7457_000461 [Penicillium paradoxum]
MGPANMPGFHQQCDVFSLQAPLPSHSRSPLNVLGTARQACDPCRKFKRRCEFCPQENVCTGCKHRNVPCTMTSTGKRQPERRTNYNRPVKELEDRIQCLERILHAAGINTELLDDKTDDAVFPADTLKAAKEPRGPRHDSMGMGQFLLPSPSSVLDTSLSDSSILDMQPTVDGLEDLSGHSLSTKDSSSSISYLIVGEEPDSYLRPEIWDLHTPSTRTSSESTTSSPMAVAPQLAARLKGNSNVHEIVSIVMDTPTQSSQVPVAIDDIGWPRTSLPPKEEILPLLKIYFDFVNILLPLYHEETFMRLVVSAYSGRSHASPELTANINIMSAIAHIAGSTGNTKECDQHFQKSSALVPYLMMNRPSLLCVQAFIAMAIFLGINGDIKSGLPLISAALQSSHQLGFHKCQNNADCDGNWTEQGNHAMDVAYILDARICVRLGLQPRSVADDVNIPLGNNMDPPGLQGQWSSSICVPGKPKFFQEMVQLSGIISVGLRNLRTNVPPTAGLNWIRDVVDDLDSQVEDWRRNLSVKIKSIRSPEEESHPSSPYHLCLQIFYYHALIVASQPPQNSINGCEGCIKISPKSSVYTAMLVMDTQFLRFPSGINTLHLDSWECAVGPDQSDEWQSGSAGMDNFAYGVEPHDLSNLSDFDFASGIFEGESFPADLQRCFFEMEGSHLFGQFSELGGSQDGLSFGLNFDSHLQMLPNEDANMPGLFPSLG